MEADLPFRTWLADSGLPTIREVTMDQLRATIYLWIDTLPDHGGRLAARLRHRHRRQFAVSRKRECHRVKHLSIAFFHEPDRPRVHPLG